jgi:hypothetical protein
VAIGQAVMNKGLLSAQYDLDETPEDPFEIIEAEELDDRHNEGPVELNPARPDPLIERVIVNREKENEMRQEQQADWPSGSYLTTYPTHFTHGVVQYDGGSWNYTYRMNSCDGCKEGFEHIHSVIEQ